MGFVRTLLNCVFIFATKFDTNTVNRHDQSPCLIANPTPPLTSRSRKSDRAFASVTMIWNYAAPSCQRVCRCLAKPRERHPGYKRALKLLNDIYRKEKLARRLAVLHAAAWLIDILEKLSGSL